MKPESMRMAIDKIKYDVCALIDEKAETIIRDMADSFVQQASEDEDKKLKFSVAIKADILPLDNKVVAKITWGIKKTATAESMIGE